MNKEKVIEALPGDTLAGLQIDLLQKIKKGGLALDELDWFLKMPRRQIMALAGKLDFTVRDDFKGLSCWSFNCFKFLFEPHMEYHLSADMDPDGTIKLFNANGWAKSRISSHPKYHPVDEQTAICLLYLLIIYPEKGKAVLNHELETRSNYVIFVRNSNTDEVSELVFNYSSIGERWHVDYCNPDDEKPEYINTKVISFVKKNSLKFDPKKVLLDQDWMYPNFDRELGITSGAGYGSEQLSADLRGKLSYFRIDGATAYRDVAKNPKFHPVQTETAMAFLYLLVIFPEYGKKVLSFSLNKEMSYWIYFVDTNMDISRISIIDTKAGFSASCQDKLAGFEDEPVSNVTVITFRPASK